MTDKEPNKEEERKQKREIALINLKDPYYQILGAVHYSAGLNGEYGKILKNLNQDAINNYPSENAYRWLFAERLASGEAITDTSLQKDAFLILRSSLEDISVEDAYKLLGLEKPLKSEYSKKYVSDLSDEEKAALISAYFSNATDTLAQKNIIGRMKQRKSQLEDMLCESDENEDNISKVPREEFEKLSDEEKATLRNYFLNAKNKSQPRIAA